MTRNENEMAWYNSLPKEKQQLLDLWEEHDLYWLTGEVWEDKPHSVELETSTPAGGDMIINLEDISVDALKEYVDNFDINYEVSLWWENGEPGRGVPFDSMDEHVEDYEEFLAELRDIIDASRGVQKELTHVQKLAVDKFKESLKELERMSIGFEYDKENGFTFHNVA